MVEGGCGVFVGLFVVFSVRFVQFYCQRGVWTVACQRRSSEVPVFVRLVLDIDVFETSKVGITKYRIADVGHLVLRTVSFDTVL